MTNITISVPFSYAFMTARRRLAQGAAWNDEAKTWTMSRDQAQAIFNDLTPMAAECESEIRYLRGRNSATAMRKRREIEKSLAALTETIGIMTEALT